MSRDASGGEGPPSVGTADLGDIEQTFLTVARVVRAHGTDGTLSCQIITEFPERFRRTKAVYVTRPQGVGREARRFAVMTARLSPRRGGTQLLLVLDGIRDRQAAEELRGCLVQVPASEAWALPEGRYYWHQIIGLRAMTAEGRELGTVSAILETGANDVYVVRLGDGELLIPAIKDVVKEIAPDRGEMIVKLLPGMEPG